MSNLYLPVDDLINLMCIDKDVEFITSWTEGSLVNYSGWTEVLK